jgi:hypothetical protein
VGHAREENEAVSRLTGTLSETALPAAAPRRERARTVGTRRNRPRTPKSLVHRTAHRHGYRLARSPHARVVQARRSFHTKAKHLLIGPKKAAVVVSRGDGGCTPVARDPSSPLPVAVASKTTQVAPTFDALIEPRGTRKSMTQGKAIELSS